MWNDLSHGFSVLADALAFLSRSWGFWVCAGSVAGLAAVYAWWRKRLALWAFVLAFLSLLAVVGYPPLSIFKACTTHHQVNQRGIVFVRACVGGSGRSLKKRILFAGKERGVFFV